jgi:hypothetical protein
MKSQSILDYIKKNQLIYPTKFNDKNRLVRYSPRLHKKYNNNKINYCYKRKYTPQKKCIKCTNKRLNFDFSILTKKGYQDKLFEIPYTLHNHDDNLIISNPYDFSDDDWIIDDDNNFSEDENSFNNKSVISKTGSQDEFDWIIDDGENPFKKECEILGSQYFCS